MERFQSFAVSRPLAAWNSFGVIHASSNRIHAPLLPWQSLSTCNTALFGPHSTRIIDALPPVSLPTAGISARSFMTDICDGSLNGSYLCFNVDHQTILPLPDDEVRKWCCRRQRYVSRINDAISYRTRELSACARLEHATVGKAEMACRPTRRRWRRRTWRQREQPIRNKFIRASTRRRGRDGSALGVPRGAVEQTSPERKQREMLRARQLRVYGKCARRINVADVPDANAATQTSHFS